MIIKSHHGGDVSRRRMWSVVISKKIKRVLMKKEG